jgi:hypothetical protein
MRILLVITHFSQQGQRHSDALACQSTIVAVKHTTYGQPDASIATRCSITVIDNGSQRFYLAPCRDGT